MTADDRLGKVILQALNDLGECVVESDGGVKFTFVNDAFCALVGYSREELLGMDTTDLVPPAEREAMMQRAKARAQSRDAHVPQETRIVHKDGHHVFIESSVRRLAEGPGFVGIIRDITPRKVAESRALVEAQVNASLVRAQSDLGEGVLMIEGDKIVHANEAYCRILGRSAETLLALPSALELVPGSDREATLAHYARIARGEPGASTRETTLLRGDGSQVAVELTVQFIPAQTSRWIVLVRDLTLRHEAEDAARQRAVTRDLVRHMLRRITGRIGREGNATFMRETGRDLAGKVAGRDMPAFLAAFAQTGLGRLQLDRHHGARYHVSGVDLLERSSPSAQPTCQLALGFLEAAAGKLADGEGLGNEVRCQSMGHTRCEFVILHRARVERAEPSLPKARLPRA